MFKNIIIVILSLGLILLYSLYEKQLEEIKNYSHIRMIPSAGLDTIKKEKMPVVVTSVDKKIIKIKTEEKKQKSKKITLFWLLEQDRFYDALALYLEETTSSNQKQIEEYLVALSKKNPKLALEYMKTFFDEEPNSLIWEEITKTYIAQKDYDKAIENILTMLEYGLSSSQEHKLSQQLREVSDTYISLLMEQKSYARLIEFLEDMIAYDEESSYYGFRLAQLYAKLEKNEKALMLLETLVYDDIYSEQAQNMIETLSQEDDASGYRYEIPLSKYGEHYVASVTLTDVT